jgi:ribose transport system permease protein
MTKRIKRTLKSKTFGLFVIFVAIFLIFTLIEKNYASIDHIRSVLYLAAQSGMLMIGFSTLLISGNADMSVVAVGCLAAVLCCKMINAGVPWPIAIILALAIGGSLGAFNALLWYKFRITPFIGTMGTAYIWQGLTNYITESRFINVTSPGFFVLGEGSFGPFPKGFIYVVILCIIYGVVLSKTRFGRQVYMSGGNVFAARLSGVNTVKIGTIMMINCSVISSLGGIVLASRMHQISLVSMSTSLMDCITATFLGGVSFGGGSGSMLGAFFGLLMLSFFNRGLVMVGMDTYWSFAAQGLLLIVALAVDHFLNLSRMRALKVR